MIVITCCHKKCGITFGVPDGWRRLRVKYGEDFYCPNGHAQFFNDGKSDEEKLREQLERSREYGRQLANERDSANASRNSYKGHVTRLKKNQTKTRRIL